MEGHSSSKCPYAAASHGASPLLRDHGRRWDLAESAETLRPASGTDHIGIEISARQAWRNSVRCVGRRLWKALKVVDARSLEEPDEIYEALITHLRQATNGGQIVPVMTVFREWLSDKPEIQIWNHQLLRYAGYKLPDGTTLGDPMNLELTKIAISLGWRPRSDPSPFDHLPVIIQVGDKLRCYDLPEKEILEVKIRHPKYPFFAEMGLRWYAVPVVSDMIFATGSKLFPCAPFNGHYLGTEIGARNLADVDRYNLLPEVAARLGLDTANARSLWKDHALLVLNEAVLWSFDNAGVRIADHHNASDDFIKFCAQEEKAGRSVSAEWSWIVPPISGAATSAFHRDYDLRPEFPNFLLRAVAWETERGKSVHASNTPRGGTVTV